MPKDREAKAVEVISRIRTSQGKSELKAIAELKVLYLDIIEKRVKKIINKYSMIVATASSRSIMGPVLISFTKGIISRSKRKGAKKRAQKIINE